MGGGGPLVRGRRSRPLGPPRRDLGLGSPHPRVPSSPRRRRLGPALPRRRAPVSTPGGLPAGDLVSAPVPSAAAGSGPVPGRDAGEKKGGGVSPPAASPSATTAAGPECPRDADAAGLSRGGLGVAAPVSDSGFSSRGALAGSRRSPRSGVSPALVSRARPPARRRASGGAGRRREPPGPATGRKKSGRAPSGLGRSPCLAPRSAVESPREVRVSPPAALPDGCRGRSRCSRLEGWAGRLPGPGAGSNLRRRPLPRPRGARLGSRGGAGFSQLFAANWFQGTFDEFRNFLGRIRLSV